MRITNNTPDPLAEALGENTTHTLVIDSGKVGQLTDFLQGRQKRPEVIREATIVDGTKLNVKFSVETRDGPESTSKKYPAPVHDDLRTAFAKLNNHLGNLCYQPITEHNPAHKENRELPALICPIHCSGFKLSGSEETEGVILFGSRTLPNAKAIDLESPQQKWDGDIYEYDDADELKDIISECISEVEMYLFEGKHAPDIQGSLFDEVKVNEEEVIEA